MFVCFCVYKSKTYSFIRFIGIKVFEYLFIQIYVMENCNSYCEIFYTQSLIRFYTEFSFSMLFSSLGKRILYLLPLIAFIILSIQTVLNIVIAIAVHMDWSDPTMKYLNSETFEPVKAYLFVATLPYSQYLYVEACGECIYRIFCRSENKGTAYYGGNEND